MKLTAVQARAYLHHISLQSENPAELAQFYAMAMDMRADQVSADLWRLTGPGRRVEIASGKSKKLGYAGFALKDAKGLEGFRSHIASAGIEVQQSPSSYFGDDAFAVEDPDGNLICFGLSRDTAPHSDGLHGPIQHLTFASTDVRAMIAFYSEMLGFQVTDTVTDDAGELKTFWSTSNHEHHTLACFKTSEQGIDHHSYEVGDWALIRDFCDHWAAHDIKVIWGPGRHGPGNNLFAFIKDVDGNKIEISAELEVIHDRETQDWPLEERTTNLWGPGFLRA